MEYDINPLRKATKILIGLSSIMRTDPSPEDIEKYKLIVVLCDKFDKIDENKLKKERLKKKEISLEMKQFFVIRQAFPRQMDEQVWFIEESKIIIFFQV